VPVFNLGCLQFITARPRDAHFALLLKISLQPLPNSTAQMTPLDRHLVSAWAGHILILLQGLQQKRPECDLLSPGSNTGSVVVARFVELARQLVASRRRRAALARQIDFGAIAEPGRSFVGGGGQ
jgi:hypothetical protein